MEHTKALQQGPKWQHIIIVDQTYNIKGCKFDRMKDEASLENHL